MCSTVDLKETKSTECKPSHPKILKLSDPPSASSVDAPATDNAVPCESALDSAQLKDESSGQSIPHIFDVRLGFNLERNRGRAYEGVWSCLGGAIKEGAKGRAGEEVIKDIFDSARKVVDEQLNNEKAHNLKSINYLFGEISNLKVKKE